MNVKFIETYFSELVTTECIVQKKNLNITHGIFKILFPYQINIINLSDTSTLNM